MTPENAARRRAALYVCGQLPREAAREVLDMLGLIPLEVTPRPRARVYGQQLQQHTVKRTTVRARGLDAARWS